MLQPYIYFGNTERKGRGVYTHEAIRTSTIIEIAPVIVMSSAERLLLDKTLLHDYIFEWGEQKDQCCMALGLIPVYNHSYQSNCEYFMDFDNQTIFVNDLHTGVYMLTVKLTDGNTATQRVVVE